MPRMRSLRKRPMGSTETTNRRTTTHTRPPPRPTQAPRKRHVAHSLPTCGECTPKGHRANSRTDGSSVVSGRRHCLGRSPGRTRERWLGAEHEGSQGLATACRHAVVGERVVTPTRITYTKQAFALDRCGDRVSAAESREPPMAEPRTLDLGQPSDHLGDGVIRLRRFDRFDTDARTPGSYETERQWQAAWLSDRLGLSA
jgi:hypothetical protein